MCWLLVCCSPVHRESERTDVLLPQTARRTKPRVGWERQQLLRKETVQILMATRTESGRTSRLVRRFATVVVSVMVPTEVADRTEPAAAVSTTASRLRKKRGPKSPGQQPRLLPDRATNHTPRPSQSQQQRTADAASEPKGDAESSVAADAQGQTHGGRQGQADSRSVRTDAGPSFFFDVGQLEPVG